MPSEPNLCPDCPLNPFWQAEVIKELREKQERYHQVKSMWGTVKLTHGIEEPSAHKICLARRVMLRKLLQSCPYFPASEDISRFAHLQVEEDKSQLVEPEEEQVTETVNPLQAQVVKRRLRQQTIRQRYL